MDVARPGENSIVYRCGDTTALAEAIRLMFGDALLRARMQNASLCIAKQLDIERSISGLLNGIATVLGDGLN